MEQNSPQQNTKQNLPIPPQVVKQNVGDRECGLMTSCAVQGMGKTYQNMHVIAKYVMDKPKTKVRGRKCLIFDTNGEYVPEEFAKNGILNFHPKKIKVSDVKAWCRDTKITAECRRIDAKSLSIPEKKQILEYLVNSVVNCLLAIEDINTYILKITNMEEIVGNIVKLRHKGVDVLMSFQSARAIEPRIWQNSRWIRLHFISENMNEIKAKLPNFQLYKIAQIMVNTQFNKGNKRFFIYITGFGRKIEGAFSLEQFKDACDKYLRLNKKEYMEHATVNDISEEQARAELVNQYIQLYYDNDKKKK